jgi:predicted NBD/HSP70 family sugar kinase
MASKPVIGLYDIGATHTRVAIAHQAESYDSYAIMPTNKSAHGIETLYQALQMAAGDREIIGLVGGIAGQIDVRTGVLFHATNLPAWNGIAIRGLLEQKFGVPVLMGNDACLVGLGEAVFGGGRGHERVIYETVSTGVNAALIVNGLLDIHAPGTEIGQQLIMGKDGHVTTLEAATGGSALERKYGHPAKELVLQGLWRSEARLLALGLHNTLVHWSPDIVVFGGSMMRDISLDDIENELKILNGDDNTLPKIVHAKLGDNGGLYGGLALARQYQML